MMRRARSSAVPSYAREGAAGAAEASAWAIGSSENRLLASQSPSISEKTAPGILMGERLDGKTWTTRERQVDAELIPWVVGMEIGRAHV